MNTTNQEPLPKPMQSIGERLEEARKRMGVSIREATETTKLRTDVIDSFEGNRFDFDLPEIYKRGFLRIYAQFLKLDSDQILTDYQAIWLTKSRGNNAPHPNEPRRTFGHLHLSNAPVAKPEAQEHTPLAQSKETVTTAEPELPDEKPSFIDNPFYWKIVISIAGGALGLLVLIVIIKSLSSGPDPSSNPVEPISRAETFPLPEGTFKETESSSSANQEVALIAKGDVRVIVRKKGSRKEIFNGAIEAGQRVPLSKEESLQISFTDGNALIVENNGAQIVPEHGGPGWISLD